MKIPRSLIPMAAPRRAFTLVEIVLSLAIIAVALVAIIGVLPLGLNVQTENQEESIVAADAAIWMEFLRNGAQGGTYFEPDASGEIFYISELKVGQVLRQRAGAELLALYDPVSSTRVSYISNFTSASELLGLLSLPKYPENILTVPDGMTYTNWSVYADVRALNGNMADLAAEKDFSFRYRMTPELVPLQGVHRDHLVTTNGPLFILQTNLYELRLRFQWPLVLGQDGYRDQTRFARSLTFRTLISGQPAYFSNAVHMRPRQYSYLTNTVTP